MDEPELAPSPSSQRWTSIDAYLPALLHRRMAARRLLKAQQRSEPQQPNILLSTLPFIALLSMLGLLFLAIALLAWPPSQPRPVGPRAGEQQRQIGTAPPGWYQEAQKEFSGARQPPKARD